MKFWLIHAQVAGTAMKPKARKVHVAAKHAYHAGLEGQRSCGALGERLGVKRYRVPATGTWG